MVTSTCECASSDFMVSSNGSDYLLAVPATISNGQSLEVSSPTMLVLRRSLLCFLNLLKAGKQAEFQDAVTPQ